MVNSPGYLKMYLVFHYEIKSGLGMFIDELCHPSLEKIQDPKIRYRRKAPKQNKMLLIMLIPSL
ncbi:MAG: hypothetical protein M3162_03680 [Thermoproteota archaeon]|nr:hypothetical protein [Thermoproteota archaeon]